MILRNLRRKDAIWLIFGLFFIFTLLASAQEHPDPPRENVPATGDIPLVENTKGNAAPTSQHELDQDAEAARALKQALSTLSTLTAHPPSYTRDTTLSNGGTSSSFLSRLLPNFQGQGPVGSMIRIIFKLHQNSWLSRLTSGILKHTMGLGPSKRKNEEMRGKAIKVIDLLQHSAELGNTDALYMLAKTSLFPPNPYFPSDPSLAYHSLLNHATLTGNASSQALLSFFHATGYKGAVPVDQAKAILYYTFAGLNGEKEAEMALGYRYWTGIGTVEDCMRALEWYQSASEKSMSKFLSGPPGGRTLPHTATRLSDLAGGVYGSGASVASTGLNAQRPPIKAGAAHSAGETWNDILEYYQFNADRGEIDFAYRLGKIFYQGSIYASLGGVASGSEGVGIVPRDFQRARYYFNRIARQVWPRDPPSPLQYVSPTQKEEPHGQVGYAAASAGYLGRMYLRGEGVKADAAMAKMWFERGAEHSDRECHNGLGIIWRDGLVMGRKDLKRALMHFSIAAGQELAEAQVNLGKHHYFRRDLKLATTYFETAIRHGSPFEAYYYLAEIQGSQAMNPAMPANMVAGSCAMAVSFHKIVAERGVWDDDLLRDADVAWRSGTERGKEIAMLKWQIAAEQGYEIAQNNLAYVLDQDRSILRLTPLSTVKISNETAKLALTHWIRSAAQRNVDALVKVGDYYYHGLGVPDEEQSLRLEKAASYYQSAADTQMSALAMWNLGWMYENGMGVPQDFHLAKRNYDLALETNSEAYIPVLFSLVKLHCRSLWHTLTGGKNGLKLWSLSEEDTNPSRPDSQELEGNRVEATENSGSVAEDGVVTEEDAGSWYLGKAKEEFHRRKLNRNAGQPQAEPEDPIEWARERRNAEREREGDFGPDDYFEGDLRGRHRGEGDELGETLLLVLLCISISILLYIRRRFVDRIRRDHEGQEQNVQGQQQPGARPPAEPPQVQQQEPVRDQGEFPPPGDPARGDWAVL